MPELRRTQPLHGTIQTPNFTARLTSPTPIPSRAWPSELELPPFQAPVCASLVLGKWKQSWRVRGEKPKMWNGRGLQVRWSLGGLLTQVPSPHNHSFWVFLGFQIASFSPALSVTSKNGALHFSPLKNTLMIFWSTTGLPPWFTLELGKTHWLA